MQRLLLAAAVGGVVGAEREFRRKSAGFRTNILIAMGSALFTMLSATLAVARGGDRTRIAAQIVTGIGFLGAGAIIRTIARRAWLDDSGDGLGQRGARRGRRRRPISPGVHRPARSR